MVDFTKLASAAPKKLASSLLETFSRLDRQVTHVELRPSQIKVLGLMDAREDARDLVLKLNTGGGKTTIGLLYLKHKLDRLKQPVVYLVPTIQLLEQVVSEGKRIGILVYPWLARESHPPEDALKGRGILVCTYDKFFNGKSTFARSDVKLIPSAVVLDDVHAGIESIRKCFSCDLPAEARVEVLSLLEADLEKADPSAWAGISSGDPRALVDVPHWLFANQITEIRRILSKHSSAQEMVLAWSHISPVLDVCRLILSGTSAHIAVDPPSLERVAHYDQAAHRLFMSASVHDGAVLIRELDCDSDAAATPVDIGGEASVGERMVIVPSLANPDFSREELRNVAIAIKDYVNVVVLVSSFPDAEFWRDGGAIVAVNSTIGNVIDGLKSRERGQIAVFAQRYDGIDLPDKACRLLIIDGLPFGESLIDRVDLEIAGDIVGTRGKIATKIEQGLGRAVRSASDYCAVLLGGRDVAGFVSRGVVLENFSPQTVRQIEIGHVVSEALGGSADRVKEVVDTVMQCLRRDNSWKDFYAEQMSVDSSLVSSIEKAAATKREIATYERQASKLAAAHDYAGAYKLLQVAANVVTDRRMRGVLKQAAAKLQYYVEPVNAMQLQVSAYSDNYNVSKPPSLLPADVRRITSQAEGISHWMAGFSEKNGALIELDELHSKLSFARSHKDVEAAVRRLGEILGAESTRPDVEFGRGPDNLWIFDSVAFIIEMKSEKKSTLSKDDGEQLQSSTLWVANNVAKISEKYSLIGSNVDRADSVGDFGFGAKLFAEADFSEMISRLRKLVSTISVEGPLFSTNAANIQKYLGPSGLLPSQLLQLVRSIRQK